MNSVQSIEDAIAKCPLLLREISDERVLKTIDKYLPFSTGFEVECGWLDQSLKDDYYNSGKQRFKEFFMSIPNIIDVNCDTEEQRFRIPAGLDGLICLYYISEKLKEHCHITNSGIHYHIDMTDWYDEAAEHKEEIVEASKDWFLKELDTWQYKGTFNARDMDDFKGARYWIRFKSSTKTCEIRIGEMTFDYEILAKRIIHANKLVRRLKGELYKVRESHRLRTLQKELDTMAEEAGIQPDALPSQEELNAIIKKRQIRINGR